MDKRTHDELQKIMKERDEHQTNLTLCDNQIFAIYDICEATNHKYPDGTSARGTYKCHICGK